MAHSNLQKKFQCDFCPTRNSWVQHILVGKDKHHICPECIAELARQIRKEKAEKDVAADPNRGTGNNPVQTEIAENASGGVLT